MSLSHKIDKKSALSLLVGGIIGLAIVSIAAIWGTGSARAQASPFHPTFPLLDAEGQNVLDTGAPVSTMETCGACHDSGFIVQHSDHAQAGLASFSPVGSLDEGRPWDSSLGYFGRWDPLTYRYLSPTTDELIDLGTAAWIQTLGLRHAGGGPTEFSREGLPLTELEVQPGDPETHVVDPESGDLVAWDWSESGTVEMNCFLCHVADPNNVARIHALQDGDFQWANTATLLGTGIVERVGSEWRWQDSAFQPDGTLAPEMVLIQDPDNQNCGACHGLVHSDIKVPFTTSGCQLDAWNTRTSGQIISPQRLSDSGMNLEDKSDLSRAWDVHAERLVACTDCHYSLNNPAYYREADETRPDHLTFDPRRLEIGEYLLQPSHQFARGEKSQVHASPALMDTMRRCDACHSVEKTHDWLPYKDRHMETVDCETCHIPRLYAPAIQQNDWTVIKPSGEASTACRGVEGGEVKLNSLISGFEPVVISREAVDGSQKLAPYNLVTSWYWIYGDPPRPVRQTDLAAAWLDGEAFSPEVVAAFDQNGDGNLEADELILDTPEKEGVIADRLAALGLENPRIQGEVQPYSINHNVATGKWAIDDCATCHSESSRITQPMKLANYLPAGVLPVLPEGGTADMSGELITTSDGALYYQPVPEQDGLYIFGKSNVSWIDWFGALLFLGVLGGVTLHGGLRVYTSMRQPAHEPEVERVYMYSMYDRLWHWLQTIAILALAFTGLIIHKPEMFGMFSFRYVVYVHNILGFILLANAFLAAFYNFASGEIRQYVPQPRGFFNQAFQQVKFYLYGIFKGEPHPFEKNQEKRLNPLQKITYFGILNVLLPLQILTGILIWGAQRWPQVAALAGGLGNLASFHTLIAWLFASFIVLHVYLTTTGHTATAGIRSMIMGWDDLEISSHSEEKGVLS